MHAGTGEKARVAAGGACHVCGFEASRLAARRPRSRWGRGGGGGGQGRRRGAPAVLETRIPGRPPPKRAILPTPDLAKAWLGTCVAEQALSVRHHRLFINFTSSSCGRPPPVAEDRSLPALVHEPSCFVLDRLHRERSHASPHASPYPQTLTSHHSPPLRTRPRRLSD